MKRRFIQRSIGPRAGLLMLLSCVIAGTGCNLFNDLGNAWGTGTPPNLCGGMGGRGAGGGGDGGGGNPGAGGSTADGTSVGAGGSDVGSAGGGQARRPWPAHRRHRGRSRLGTAFEADCPDMGGDPGMPMMAPKIPLVDGLTTMRLRAIAVANGIGAGHTGVQFNRDVGLAFENWVLVMLGQVPRWTTPIPSPDRKKANSNGLPASVIPEFVSGLQLVDWGAMTAIPFPESQFWEVKAVTGTLTRSTSKYQIAGFIDVASLSPAGMSTVVKHPPPAVVFTTTWNTKIGADVLAAASMRHVAIWQQVVFEDGTIPNDPNPDLYIGPLVAVNPDVYGTAVPVPSNPSGAHSKLTSPTTPPMPVPGDPDPPEVD